MSSNPFYTHSDGVPAFNSAGSSQLVRAEFDSVAAGFTAVEAAIVGIQNQAFTTSPTVPTPPQFDNSQKAADTAFVQSSKGFQVPSIISPTTTTTLTVAQLGSLVEFTGTAPYTVTLPAMTASMNGSGFMFQNTTSGVITLSTSGTDRLLSSGGVQVQTITFNPGDTLTVYANGAGAWIMGGSAIAALAPQQQSLTSSVASNALTIGLNPTTLLFRNANLTLGTPTSISLNSALSIVAPSGASFGATGGQQCQVAILALNNAGSVSLGLVNTAGMLDLDETTLVSTTAISAGSTANNVIYSAAALTNVPFRVVGYFLATEATAGQWSSLPSTLQGIGGEATIFGLGGVFTPPIACQQNLYASASAGGTSDAITAAFNPSFSATTFLAGNVQVSVRASLANLTTTPTFYAGYGSPVTIVKGNGLPLAPGDIAGAGHWIDLNWDATLGKWILLNPATGVGVPNQIQSVTATVAGNALTVGLQPCALSFRNATLTNGVAANYSIASALSLTVPTGATFGSSSGTQCQIAILALNNVGTISLGVVNMSGGVNLDETTLVSTTAISGTACANNVIYSATALTNVPFRVVGYLTATETTAGIWATAPTLVQGEGGVAMTSMQSLGNGQQTWQTVTRVSGTTYYNTTSRPILIEISGQTSLTSAQLYLSVNGVVVINLLWVSITGNIPGVLTAIVPPGGTYVFNAVNMGTMSAVELR